MLFGIKRKAKKLVRTSSNGRELLKKFGDFNTLNFSSRYMESTKELFEVRSTFYSCFPSLGANLEVITNFNFFNVTSRVIRTKLWSKKKQKNRL
jgi:hypothetical protein